MEKRPGFEEKLSALETLVRKMEQGEMPLDEMLKDYQKGIKMAAALEKELSMAEKTMLELKDGRLTEMEDAP